MLFTALAAPETGGDFGGGPHCSRTVTPALLAPVTGRSAPLAVTGLVESAQCFRTLRGPRCLWRRPRTAGTPQRQADDANASPRDPVSNANQKCTRRRGTPTADAQHTPNGTAPGDSSLSPSGGAAISGGTTTLEDPRVIEMWNEAASARELTAGSSGAMPSSVQRGLPHRRVDSSEVGGDRPAHGPGTVGGDVAVVDDHVARSKGVVHSVE
jgi:hypothetical protein